MYMCTYTHMCICVRYQYGVASISRLLKIKVSFAKEPYKRDDILQKRPIISRRLLIVATPYVRQHVKHSVHVKTLV